MRQQHRGQDTKPKTPNPNPKHAPGREDLVAVVGDEQRVLELRRARAVPRHGRPLVWPRVAL